MNNQAYKILGNSLSNIEALVDDLLRESEEKDKTIQQLEEQISDLKKEIEELKDV